MQIGHGSVLLNDAMNTRVPSRFRATANSFTSFAFRGAYVLTAPLAGALLDGPGMTLTLWALAVGSLLILRFVMLPLAQIARKGRVM